MKILMLLPQPFFEPRGTSFSSLLRLQTMARMGHQIDLLTYPFGKDISEENLRIFRIPRLPFIKGARVGPSKEKLFLDLVLILYAIRMASSKRYDLIHSHEEACFLAAILSRYLGIPHLYDMHSSLPQQLINFNFTKSRLILGLFQWSERATLRNADAVIAICAELGRHARQVCHTAKVSVIENVLEVERPLDTLGEDPRELRDRYNLDHAKVVLYTGTFEHYQGLDLLIQASEDVVRRHKEVRFVLVGGKPEQVRHYQSLAAEAKVGDHFVFVGSVPPERVEDFYKIADLLVTPRFEGTNTPLKIYSYLRSGVPIVATDHITHTQVLNNNVAVLTRVDPPSLAAGLLRLLEDPRFGTRLAKNAKRLAESEYSPRVYWSKLEELLEEIEKGTHWRTH